MYPSGLLTLGSFGELGHSSCVVSCSSHQSGEVGMASFFRMDSTSNPLPSMLSALEEQNFLFQLQLNDQPQEDTNEVGLEK